MRALTIVLIISLALSGCSTTSTGGVVLGVRGSTAWHQYAPPSDIREYWYGASMIRLRTAWDSAYNSSKVREAIGNELARQGHDPMMFYDSQADASRRLADKIEAANSRARQAEWDAEDARREAEQTRRDMQRNCDNSGGMLIGSNCW